MEGFGGFFNDPEFQKRLQEMAEQMQGTQSLAWADNAIKLAVDMTVAAYSVGQQIAIAALTFGIGFLALIQIFRFRSFKEVIASGRAAREQEEAAVS